MIDMVVWSKDRPCQLDLLLRSTFKYFKSVSKIWIIYKATQNEYAMGYSQLQNTGHGKIPFYIKQDNFKNDIIGVLRQCTERVLGNSDDNVFINEVPEIPNVDNFSLRLYPKINRCQPANLEIQPPDWHYWSLGKEDYFGWDTDFCDPRGCWGYPSPCDSNIYKRDSWIKQIEKGIFHNPASMEVWMNNHRPEDRIMYCFNRACLISVSNNVTQDGSINPCGSLTIKKLNDLYLKGKQIRLEPFDELVSNACHIIKDYEMEDVNA